MKIFVLVFGGIGLILLAFAGVSYMREADFLGRAESASGQVVDFNLSSSTEGGSSYCPVIDFTTKDGQPVKYFANVCSSPPSYDIGEEVQVLYDPEDPKKVQMDGFWSKYVGTFVLSCIGLPFFAIGIWGLFVGRQKPRQN